MPKKILLIHCAENSKRALSRMQQLGITLPPEIQTIEIPCNGRVGTEALLEHLGNGFDGVLVAACHKQNCRHLDGNLRAEKRVAGIKQLLTGASISGKFVDIVFTGPGEGRGLQQKIKAFINQVNKDGI